MMENIIIKKLIFCISTLIIGSSCTTTYMVSAIDYYDINYNGETYNNIVKDLGAPNRTQSDGEGGTILIYEKYSSQTQYYSGSQYNPPSSQSLNKRSFVEFYIDGETNTCYQILTNHMTTKTEEKIDWNKVLSAYPLLYALIIPFLFLLK